MLYFEHTLGEKSKVCCYMRLFQLEFLFIFYKSTHILSTLQSVFSSTNPVCEQLMTYNDIYLTYIDI